MSAISGSFASLISALDSNNTPAAAPAGAPAQPAVQPPTAVNPVQTQSSGQNLASLIQTTVLQQVQQLYRDGHTVPQIAFSLDLSAQAVDTYLKISKT